MNIVTNLKKIITILLSISFKFLYIPDKKKLKKGTMNFGYFFEFLKTIGIIDPYNFEYKRFGP